MSTYNEAHRCATSYATSPELCQIFRAEKSLKEIIFHLFLGQVFKLKDLTVIYFWSNGSHLKVLLIMSTKNNKDLDLSLDFKLGRSGDWRRAPKDWDIYHTQVMMIIRNPVTAEGG